MPWFWVVAALAAAATPARAEPRAGFYLGAFGGGAAVRTDVVTVPFRLSRDLDAPAPGANGTAATVPLSRGARIGALELGNRNGSGAVWGLRAGYATPLWGWLFGAIELEYLQPRLASVNLTFLGNRYRTALENEGAAYLRLGWWAREGTTLFFRSGLAVPQQVTTLNGGTTRRVTPTPGFGIGAEQTLRAGLSLRADVTWLPAVENNRISSFRGTVGLAYGF